MIRKISDDDVGGVTSIYNHYIEHTFISFEETVVSTEEMAGRIDKVTATGLPWLVASNENGIVGYAYAGIWNSRSAYRFTVESTIYLEKSRTGKGVGTGLMEALLAELRKGDVRSVIAGVALPNVASVALHEKLGYQKVAHYSEVGWKFNQWIDVGYWQLKL